MSRYWFNQAVEYLRQPNTKAALSEVRKIQKNQHPEWAFDCPQRVREHAMTQACESVKNAKKKFVITKQYQEVKFRSKKDLEQRFGFDKISLHKNFVFKNKKHKFNFFASENFQATLEGVEIKREKGRWFLIAPQKVTIKKPENQRHGIVALDPGIRTFIAYYADGLCGKIGEGDFNRIFRLCLNLDKMIAKSTKVKSKQRRSMKKAMARLRWKIKDLVDDMHKKTANFLVKNFDKILIPYFETSEMSRKLRSKTARSLLSFSHFRFKEFLKAKAEEYSCEIIEVSEAWTSRTCSYCGRVHAKNSKKRMICSCGANVDRDLNGARGIYLRALAASPNQVNLIVNDEY